MADDTLSPRVAALAAGSVALLKKAAADYRDVAYSNSLGMEAMVLTDLIWTQVPEISIFTIDTGRLNDETLGLLDRLERRYERRFDLFYPDGAAVEAYVRNNGINGFYTGLEERQSCCQVRKVEPFKRAIAGKKAWVTGVRREQSAERAQGQPLSWDDRYDLWKVSPLLDWTEADINEYVKVKNLIYNPLHDKGFPSIGCAPCTRAVEPGADPRSGRWWWENAGAARCSATPGLKPSDRARS